MPRAGSITLSDARGSTCRSRASPAADARATMLRELMKQHDNVKLTDLLRTFAVYPNTPERALGYHR